MGKNSKRKAGGKRTPQTTALARPMQGIDQKSFLFNDIVPVTISDPENSSQLLCIISADVNGFTVAIVNANTGTTLSVLSRLYGQLTSQFDTQAMFYNQYYMQSLQFDLTLTQGGASYSISPIVTQMNPNGVSPFVYSPGSTDFIEQLSATQNVAIHNPYQRQATKLDYQRWLMSMSDRAWRQTRSAGTATREIYPSDGAGNEFFKLPSIVKAFAITIPQGTFSAGAGSFILGILEFRSRYCFSQRRTDINDLVGGIIRGKQEEARQDERDEIKKRIASAAGYPTVDVEMIKTTPDE